MFIHRKSAVKYTCWGMQETWICMRSFSLSNIKYQNGVSVIVLQWGSNHTPRCKLSCLTRLLIKKYVFLRLFNLPHFFCLCMWCLLLIVSKIYFFKNAACWDSIMLYKSHFIVGTWGDNGIHCYRKILPDSQQKVQCRTLVGAGEDNKIQYIVIKWSGEIW